MSNNCEDCLYGFKLVQTKHSWYECKYSIEVLKLPRWVNISEHGSLAPKSSLACSTFKLKS
jgi:hypothetical protein